MNLISGGRVLIDDVVRNCSTKGNAIEDTGYAGKVLADLDSRNGGVDGVVVGSGFLGFGITFLLGIEGIHLGGSTTQPKENAMLGLTLKTIFQSRFHSLAQTTNARN
jgi:hypothetical protein